MQTTTMLLLDRWKAAKGIKTDSAAAARLHLQPSAVSNWRHGRSHAEPVSAEKMALDLKLDVCAVLCAIEADRAKAGEVQKVWSRYGKAAFMALLMGLSFQVAAVAPPPNTGHNGTPHYAKWRRRVPKSQRWAKPGRKRRPRRQPKRFVVGMGQSYV